MLRPWRRREPELRDEWHDLVGELEEQNEEACEVLDEVRVLLERLGKERRRD